MAVASSKSVLPLENGLSGNVTPVNGIEFPLPAGIEVAIDPKQTRLTVRGIDRQKVGQVAADMRSLRKPDPYKNKGVRYVDERLKKKVGKTGAK